MAKDRKETRPTYLQIRKEWNVNPVTKIVPNKKKQQYDRKKFNLDKQMRESAMKYSVEIEFSPVTIVFSVYTDYLSEEHIFTELIDIANDLISHCKIVAKEAMEYGSLMVGTDVYSTDEVIYVNENGKARMKLRIVVHSNNFGDKMRLKDEVKNKRGYKIVF